MTGNFRRRLMGLQVLSLALPLSLFAQVQDPGQQRSQQASASYRPPTEPSDLAKENLARVAASAAQIRVVLVKEPGILVELKRWVAKEATDNGQIVEDSALTDDAIFERLERDLAFRSVATLLVQRYGYLLPSFNPSSYIAKEQELVLKERARRLVQIESQEDSQSLQYGGNRESQGQRMQQPQFPPGAAHPDETQNPAGERRSRRIRIADRRHRRSRNDAPRRQLCELGSAPNGKRRGTRTGSPCAIGAAFHW